MTASPYVEDEARIVAHATKLRSYGPEYLGFLSIDAKAAIIREAARRELKRRELFSAKAGEKG